MYIRQCCSTFQTKMKHYIIHNNKMVGRLLTLSVPVNYQQPTSPYITYTKYDIWWWENENWSNKANYWRLKVKFSQICSMKSMGSGWENLKILLALKGLRNKTCFSCLHSLVKTEANVWADQWKPEIQSKVSPAREFSTTLPRFSTGYGGTDNMFYFFYRIIIFIVNNKERQYTVRSAYCKFSQLGDSQTTLLTPFSCFIALSKYTCKPIKMHVLSKLFYNKGKKGGHLEAPSPQLF